MFLRLLKHHMSLDKLLAYPLIHLPLALAFLIVSFACDGLPKIIVEMIESVEAFPEIKERISS